MKKSVIVELSDIMLHAESMGYTWNEAYGHLDEVVSQEVPKIDIDLYEGQVYIGESEMQCEIGCDLLISFMQKNEISEFTYVG